MTRRFQPPWHVEELEESFAVVTANGLIVSYTYVKDPRSPIDRPNRHPRDEARRLANGIAKLPGLLKGG